MVGAIPPWLPRLGFGAGTGHRPYAKSMFLGLLNRCSRISRTEYQDYSQVIAVTLADINRAELEVCDLQIMRDRTSTRKYRKVDKS